MIKYRPYAPFVLALILLATLLRAIIFYLSGVELHYDEAQYWEWAQTLDWSYYSKGPLVAWLIALSECLFGHGVWQTRLPASLASGVFMWLLYRCTLTVWQNHYAAVWAIILSLFCPIYFLLGGIMTTDIFLFVFYTWGIDAAYRAVILKKPTAWWSFGMAVGLGCLSKLTMLLLPFSVFLVIWLDTTYRRQLLTRYPWQAAGIALLLVSPMLIWNTQHHWVMLRHELGHIQAGSRSIYGLLAFLWEQTLVFLPLFTLSVMWLIRRIKGLKQPTENLPEHREGCLFLWRILWICLVFFMLRALSGKVQLNWPAPIYISVLIILSGTVTKQSARMKAIFYSVLAFMFATMALALFPQSLGIKTQSAPFKDMRAWSAPVQQLYGSLKGTDFIIASTYKLAAEMAYYWPEPIHIYVAEQAERRYNQHDLWPNIDREAGRNGAYISRSPSPPHTLRKAFTQCHALAPLPAKENDGSLMRTLYITQCIDYRPTAWPKPLGY